MARQKQHISAYRFSEKNTEKNHMVRDILPLLVENGNYEDLWRSPGFQQAYHLSSFLQQSAGLLKKHLPPRFHQQIRFTQNPDTWVLGVFDAGVVNTLGKVLKEEYGSIMRDESGLPQHVKLRRVYRNWDQFGAELSTLSFNHAKHVECLKMAIPEYLHKSVRLRYEPSVWQITVEKSAVATQLNLLLDELSMRIAKDMKFAPKLKINVKPSDWKSSGFMLTELVKEKKVKLNEVEAEQFLNDFLKKSSSNH